MSPSHCVFHPVFGPEVSAAMLDYAIGNEHRFQDAGVGRGNEQRQDIRAARRLGNLGPFRAVVEERMRDEVVPQAMESLGLTRLDVNALEIDMVASEDGAFYKRHIDLAVAPDDRRHASHDRVVSIVYYLHGEPRGFDGGELRLFPHATPLAPGEPLDITPLHDMAVAFSSWLPHEVRPVRCASRKFRDARFSINCWAAREIVRAVPP